MRCQRCDKRVRRPVRRAKLAERDAKVALVLDAPMQESAPPAGSAGRTGASLDASKSYSAMLTGDVEVATRHLTQPTFPQPDTADGTDGGRQTALTAVGGAGSTYVPSTGVMSPRACAPFRSTSRAVCGRSSVAPCCTPWRSAEPILEPVPAALAHVRLAGSARGLDLVAARSIRLRTNDLGV